MTLTILQIKAAVRERDGFRCTLCGMTNEQHVAKTENQLEVHRTTPGSPYTLDGCVTLCRACHGPQPKRQPGVADQSRGGKQPLAVWIDPEIAAALQDYLDGTEPSVFKTAAVESALKDFLRGKGHWPPPAKREAE